MVSVGRALRFAVTMLRPGIKCSLVDGGSDIVQGACIFRRDQTKN